MTQAVVFLTQVTLTACLVLLSWSFLKQIFISLKTDIPKKRVKRGSFNRFFEYVFGDADLQLRNLETFSRQELQMVNFLIDKSNSTDLAIKHDETIIDNLFQDIKIEQLRLEDLTL